MEQFPNIALFIGTIMIIVNTTQMSECAQTDKRINNFYSLNIASIVFLGVFIVAHYIAPFMHTTAR
jgi:uncharacterized membrane protein